VSNSLIDRMISLLAGSNKKPGVILTTPGFDKLAKA
jgi:hypothetical protein